LPGLLFSIKPGIINSKPEIINNKPEIKKALRVCRRPFFLPGFIAVQKPAMLKSPKRVF